MLLSFVLRCGSPPLSSSCYGGVGGEVLLEGGGMDGIAPGAQLAGVVGGNFLTSSWLLQLQPLLGPSLPLASLLGQVRSLGVLSRTVRVKMWGAFQV